MALQPSPPGEVKIDGKNAADGQSTHARGSVELSAQIRGQQKPGESNAGQVRLVVFYSTSRTAISSGGGNFIGSGPTSTTGARVASGWGGARTATVTLSGLSINTRYYWRAYVEQRNLTTVSNARGGSFWTERTPSAVRIDSPRENSVIAQGNDVLVDWTFRDADTAPKDTQDAFQVRWRVSETLTSPASSWVVSNVHNTAVTQFSIGAGQFRANESHDIQVRTRDNHSRGSEWGPWAGISIYVTGSTRSPLLEYPIRNEAAAVDQDLTFLWQYRDPQSSDKQVRADIQYRAAGTDVWTFLPGEESPGTPGNDDSWTIPSGTFEPGIRYEWQVRTYDSSGSDVSDWSTSGYFWAIRTPGWQAAEDGALNVRVPQGSLGQGTYRVFAYDQGGQVVRGEIPAFSTMRWHRLRDDISSATLRTNGYGSDGGQFLSTLRTWAHELVIFRGDERVWEGPITRLAYLADGMEIEARDPMVYVYRRIMRQGYNDNYGSGNKRLQARGIQGSRSAVERASIIIQNALAPWDPNVLPWMTRFDFGDDAKESRTVADWAKTAWEEVDDLAATGGIDYTTVGRRIILHDTHRPVGRLAEMGPGDFFDTPVITEYGMNAANIFGVTNNSGIYGVFEFPQAEWYGIGPLEMLASAYGESGAGSVSTTTSADRREKQKSLNSQALRNISGRWAQGNLFEGDYVVTGAPLVVRIPDNSRIHPDAYVGINQLVPGVHIPLRAITPARSLAQVQKLDSVAVEVTDGNDEKVQVVMSPAPLSGLDPDQASAGEDET